MDPTMTVIVVTVQMMNITLFMSISSTHNIENMTDCLNTLWKIDLNLSRFRGDYSVDLSLYDMSNDLISAYHNNYNKNLSHEDIFAKLRVSMNFIRDYIPDNPYKLHVVFRSLYEHIDSEHIIKFMSEQINVYEWSFQCNTNFDEIANFVAKSIFIERVLFDKPPDIDSVQDRLLQYNTPLHMGPGFTELLWSRTCALNSLKIACVLSVDDEDWLKYVGKLSKVQCKLRTSKLDIIKTLNYESKNAISLHKLNSRIEYARTQNGDFKTLNIIENDSSTEIIVNFGNPKNHNQRFTHSFTTCQMSRIHLFDMLWIICRDLQPECVRCTQRTFALFVADLLKIFPCITKILYGNVDFETISPIVNVLTNDKQPSSIKCVALNTVTLEDDAFFKLLQSDKVPRRKIHVFCMSINTQDEYDSLVTVLTNTRVMSVWINQIWFNTETELFDDTEDEFEMNIRNLMYAVHVRAQMFVVVQFEFKLYSASNKKKSDSDKKYEGSKNKDVLSLLCKRLQDFQLEPPSDHKVMGYEEYWDELSWYATSAGDKNDSDDGNDDSDISSDDPCNTSDED